MEKNSYQGQKSKYIRVKEIFKLANEIKKLNCLNIVPCLLIPVSPIHPISIYLFIFDAPFS